LVSACGSGAGGTVVSVYTSANEKATFSALARRCNAELGGRFSIKQVSLPKGADDQRLQLARRLTGNDKNLDIMGLDVTWEAEFAEAGWIEPWTGANRTAAEDGTLKAALETAMWKGQLYAVPANTNTQLLWSRSDLVPNPPKTWAEMIQDAENLAKQGKPHYIEIQGAQYEGGTVWFNTMNSSAGGTVLNPDATKVTLGEPALKALTIMKQLADSPAADPSLPVQMENENRLAMEAGTAAFQLNYPFVYPAMKADNPKLFKSFKWALYPEVVPGQPAKVTIGGIDLAVSSFSTHKALAFQAALCLRDRQNQIIGANVGGVPPTIESLYNDPALAKNYPFHADILKALQNASVRPKTPVYQVVSIDISHLISPASSISPQSTLDSMKSQINQGLQSKGLVP